MPRCDRVAIRPDGTLERPLVVLPLDPWRDAGAAQVVRRGDRGPGAAGHGGPAKRACPRLGRQQAVAPPHTPEPAVHAPALGADNPAVLSWLAAC
jgi:hypothetical protein